MNLSYMVQRANILFFRNEHLVKSFEVTHVVGLSHPTALQTCRFSPRSYASSLLGSTSAAQSGR